MKTFIIALLLLTMGCKKRYYEPGHEYIVNKEIITGVDTVSTNVPVTDMVKVNDGIQLYIKEIGGCEYIILNKIGENVELRHHEGCTNYLKHNR